MSRNLDLFSASPEQISALEARNATLFYRSTNGTTTAVEFVRCKHFCGGTNVTYRMIGERRLRNDVSQEFRIEMTKVLAERAERTARLLSKFAGLPDEFAMLKGVLCMTHGMVPGTAEYDAADLLFDSDMIAERMDAISKSMLDALRAKMAKS